MNKMDPKTEHIADPCERPIFKLLDKIWDKLPSIVGTILATVIIFIIGSTMRGDWLMILVHFLKYYKNDNSTLFGDISYNDNWFHSTLSYYKLQGFWKFILIDACFSYSIYFGFGGFLHWWFYVRQKDHPETWKCQPNKWLSPELEWREIKVGGRNVFLGSLMFGCLACYIDNGGDTTLYFKLDEMGWIYLILSIPINFLYNDAWAYYLHRILHSSLLYKHIHKEHHLYKQPTPFSVSALHPIEFFMFQILMVIPAFTVPLHIGIYFLNLIYLFYYGIVTHSGIHWKSIWPWQPDVIFHDNHHQYFHVNFGFNTTIFDRIHGTYRLKDRVYSEEIYGGKGKPMEQSTADEIKTHYEELTYESEPPKDK